MEHPLRVVPRQCTREVACPDIYLSVSLSFPEMAAEASAASIGTQLFKDVITRALTDLYGVVGGAVGFSLLDLRGCCGILRLDKRDEEKLWAAAALATEYGGHCVRVEVLRSSPFLTALAVDSRQWAAERAAQHLGGS